jgi:hypothetical protein
LSSSQPQTSAHHCVTRSSPAIAPFSARTDHIPWRPPSLPGRPVDFPQRTAHRPHRRGHRP